MLQTKVVDAGSQDGMAVVHKEHLDWGRDVSLIAGADIAPSAVHGS